MLGAESARAARGASARRRLRVPPRAAASRGCGSSPDGWNERLEAALELVDADADRGRACSSRRRSAPRVERRARRARRAAARRPAVASDRWPRWRRRSCAGAGIPVRIAAARPAGSRRAGRSPGSTPVARRRGAPRGQAAALLGERPPSPPGGGLTGRRLAAESGQALPLVLGGILALVACTLALAAIGGAVTGKSRVQRAADLAALSAARSMRDDFDRLFVAGARSRTARRTPITSTSASTSTRAEAAAVEAARRNGVEPRRLADRVPGPRLVRAAARPGRDRGRARRRGSARTGQRPRRGRGGAGERRARCGRRPGRRFRRRLLRPARLPPGGARCARTSRRPSTGWPPRRPRTGSR